MDKDAIVIYSVPPDAAAVLANQLCQRLVKEGLLEPLRNPSTAQRYEQFCEAIADELFQAGLK